MPATDAAGKDKGGKAEPERSAVLVEVFTGASPMIPNENQLIRQHEGMVRMIAKRYAHCTSLPREDLLAIGRSGLLNGIRCYDPSKGKFAIFAFINIRGYILNAITHDRKEWPIGFMMSLDAPICESGEEIGTLHDRVTIQPAVSVERQQQLRRALWRLPPDQRHRMTAMAHGTPQALDNLAKSRERNRQLRAVALSRLQKIYRQIEAITL